VSDHPRIRNFGILIVLVVLFSLPTIFLPPSLMLDVVSLLMLIFGCTGLYLITAEAWDAFWQGYRDRASLALYGLFALFLSVVLMRTYGILTRNVEGAEWLSETYAYSALVAVQLVGLWLFSHASTPPSVATKGGRWGQLIVGVIIGSLIGASKLFEPIVAAVGKLVARFL
jgi:small-conductance mechanosensitive channel